MLRKLALLASLSLALVWAISAATTIAATPISVYGAWHCGSDACIWGSVCDMTDFDTNENSTGSYVQSVATKVGSTNGMLGYMFWAAECQGTRTICTIPPNDCKGGVGGGAKTYNIPIPMPPLRQS